jgi:long-chain acyl-CoA synthetase
MFATTQLLRRATTINGEGTATLFGPRRQSWHDLQDRVARLAGALQGLGVAGDEPVAILAHNSDRYFEALFGIPWAGGVVQPINTRLAPPEIEHWLTDSGARILLIDRHFVGAFEGIRPSLPEIERVIWMDDGDVPGGMDDYEALLAASPAVADAGRGGEDIAQLMYTGGTTGRSKGVMLSHRAVVSNVLQCLPGFGIDSGSRCLHAAPMFHAADNIFCLCATAVAATQVIVPGFEPVSTLQAMAAERISAVLLVPTMINMLVHHPDFDEHDLDSLGLVLYGASPMPEGVLRRAMTALPGVEFIQAYGQTEAGPVLTMLPAKDHVLDGPGSERVRSAGRPIPCVDIEIRDHAGHALAPGEVGEICARGPNLMSGYRNLPDVSEATLRGGWLHTGDGAYMDEDGYVYIVDRLKDVIVSGAENVYSAETENAVHQHPAVAECAVIGVPDEQWGERVHAIVRLKPGESVTEDALIEHCHTLIAGYKCPRSVTFREEPLPLSGAGKILKRALRAPYWEGQSRDVN